MKVESSSSDKEPIDLEAIVIKCEKETLTSKDDLAVYRNLKGLPFQLANVCSDALIARLLIRVRALESEVNKMKLRERKSPIGKRINTFTVKS